MSPMKNPNSPRRLADGNVGIQRRVAESQRGYGRQHLCVSAPLRLCVKIFGAGGEYFTFGEEYEIMRVRLLRKGRSRSKEENAACQVHEGREKHD